MQALSPKKFIWSGNANYWNKLSEDSALVPSPNTTRPPATQIRAIPTLTVYHNNISMPEKTGRKG